MRLAPTLTLLALLAAAPAARADLSRFDLRGPGSVFRGERAHFHGKTGRPYAGKLVATRVGVDGERLVFQENAVLSEGRWAVRPEGQLFPIKFIRVKALPPVVPASAPLAAKLATVQVFHWDGGETGTGRFLEGLGRAGSPLVTPRDYRVRWALAGQQATRENLGYALKTLADRGYVLDCYFAVHGYPILLADGNWTDVRTTPGLSSVRLFATTACYGAEGAPDFLAAGVRTYVAARGVNFVSAPALILLGRSLAKGRTIEEANRRSYGFLHRAGTWWPLRWLGRKAAGVGKDGDLEGAYEASRPIVFGDATLTMRTPLRGPTPPETQAEGFLRRLQDLTAFPITPLSPILPVLR